jgi:hypothetical protein
MILIKLDENGMLPLKALEPLIDTERVDSYSFEQKEGLLFVMFYDKNGEKILPKANNEERKGKHEKHE